MRIRPLFFRALHRPWPRLTSGWRVLSRPTTSRKRRLVYLAAALLFGSIWLGNFFVASVVLPDRPHPVSLPYSTFRQEAARGNVAEVVSRGDLINGVLRQPLDYPAPNGTSVTSFVTVRPAFAEPGLETLLEEHGTVINAHSLLEPRSWWLNLLLAFGPTVLLVGGIVWLVRRTGGMLGMGRSRARRYEPAHDGRPVTFDDVAGIDESKAELAEVVDFLKDPDRYTRLGGSAPKGILLVGSPGTGKTLLAQAVAGEAGVPFFSIGASEFVEMVVGVGASRVRDLFRQARKAGSSIIFIDEVDAVGRARGQPSVGGSDEREQTLNQILTEMDGFDSGEGIIVLAATNRPDVLDPALLRPGRFDRRVFVPSPDKKGREAILKVHARGVPLAHDVHLSRVAAATPGLVGADLRNLVNEAALHAARHGQERVRQRDFLDALEKLTLGPARQLLMSASERQRIAYHEAGHTILGLVVPGADPVHRVTIIPRGQALGVTYQRPEDDRHNYEEGYLRAVITGALGGRAAEQLVYGTRTTGSENDLERATGLAQHMVTRWGMSERFGPMSLMRRDGLPAPALHAAVGQAFPAVASEATAQAVDAETQLILQDCYSLGLELLRRYRGQLDALAAALLERETLDEHQILEVTGLAPAPSLQGAAVTGRP